MDLVKRGSRRAQRRAPVFALLLALLLLSASFAVATSCTTVLGIDTDYGPNECIAGVDDAGVKLKPLNCGMGACLKILPHCDENGLPTACPDAGTPAEETCNGVDDNCDGVVDEGCPCMDGQTQPCYRGAVGTRNTGLCRDGTQTCKNGIWLECVGDTLPVPESCDQRDNDCNGKVDDSAECTCSVGQKQPCYTGPDGTLNHGTTAPCKEGSQTCAANGQWSDCVGAVAPGPEICDGIDNNCDGLADESLTGCCQSGIVKSCYTGPKMPLDTEGVGACKSGTQSCVNGQLGLCVGEVVPSPEQCNGVDDDCNGQIDDGEFGIGMPCTIATIQGPCALGEKACGSNGPFCKQVVFPATETCDGVDNDCDGTVDNGNPGGGGFCTLTDPAIKGECVNGTSQCLGGHIVCVSSTPAKPEICNTNDDDCNGKADDGPFCCPNLLKDGNETDVDCGGGDSTCPRCAAGLNCVQDLDCQSLICKTNKCQAAACNDFVKNGLETDIDCGGPICLNRCNVGQTCKTPSDCTSNVCVSNVCIVPACSDGVQNGLETDLNCGGPICPPCAQSQKCVVNTDCQSKICANGFCTGSNCSDTVLNGLETDIDCGGTCLGCDIGKKCVVGTDCKSAVCGATFCQPPTCSDGVQNGNETDVDCGGPCPLKCGIGYKCNTGSDCSSSVCNNGFCAQKPNGALCGGPSECSSGNCIDGVCCNTSCGGVCLACTAAKKGAGNDGLCGTIGAGADPDAECADQGSASCGTNGFCNGAGACQVYPTGTTCIPASCAADGIMLNNAGTCNGLGACISGGITNCSPSTCASAVCVTACAMDTQCAATAYCNGSTCIAKKADGAACGINKECLSSNCVDGVCCNLPCAGPCQACTAAKKGGGVEGICGNITTGTDPDNECAFQNQSTCGGTGFCDGFGKCQLYPGGASCAPVGCASTSTLDKGKQCDGNGNCVPNGTQNCGSYVCSGAACLTSCVTSADCVATAFCSGATCVPKKPQGASCAAPGDCVSGFCVDGVCCDAACGGTCQACTAALKGYGTDGSCQATLIGSDPENECPDQGAASCGNNGFCDGSGACAKYTLGTQCVAQTCAADGVTLDKPRQCDGAGTCTTGTTQTCAPYVCTGSACLTSCTSSIQCAPGFSCNNGSCTTACTNDSQCGSTAYCNGGICVNKVPIGAACTAPNQCQSDFCVDGVCCNTACSGTCQACAALLKGGGTDGTCGPVAAGADPQGECADQGSMSCGNNGVCNGASACQKYSAGTQCGAASCSNGTQTSASFCNGTGTCLGGGPSSCGLYTCGGTACKTACSIDADCVTGAYCSGSTCQAKLANGAACVSDNECGSNFCVDGFCCNSACNGTCQACSNILKGSGNNGACGSIAAGTDPGSECADQLAPSCGTNGSCDGAGACQKYVVGTQCTSGSCAGDGVTLTSASTCNGNGTCVPGTTSSCTPFACVNGACANGACTMDSQCAPTAFCNGTTCVTKKMQGTACGSNHECTTNLCVDGVCCDLACSGTCQACTALLKGSGTDGTCGPVAAGADPNDECGNQGAASCGTNGVCNGSGACQLYASATVCAAASCTGSTANLTKTCDGLGNCIDNGSTNCAPYNCAAGACLTSCTIDGQCVASAYCTSTTSGSCAAQKGQGAVCGSDHECTSNHCVDGFCCDLTCAGGCFACSSALTGQLNGTCGPISAGALAKPGSCTPQAQATCGLDGNCDGTGNCEKWSSATQCIAPSCTVSTQTSAANCNGTGTCNTPATTDCAPYACGATACKASCTADSDCSTGNYCLATACVPTKANGATCGVVNECSSNNCVDGTCCSTSSCGACNACNIAGSEGTCAAMPAGPDTTGPNTCTSSCTGSTATSKVCDGAGSCVTGTINCGVYKCNGAGTACVTSCTTPANDCTNASATCSSGACLLPLNSTNGVACTADSALELCASNYCNSGGTDKCDNCGTCGTGYSCTSNVCLGSGGKPCLASSQCSSGLSCSSSGACLANNGQACAASVSCASNFCSTTCQACTMASDCGTGGTCASGHCLRAASAPCSTNNQCASNVCSAGTCAAACTVTCPSNYACLSGVCAGVPGVPCVDGTQCVSGTCTAAGLCQ